MNPTIQLMLRIQEVDSEIRKLEGRVIEADTILRQIAKDREKRRSAVAELEKKSAELNSRENQLESDLLALESKQTALRRKTEMVKTQKELAAIEHELSGVAEKVSAREEEALTAMERSEALATEINARKKQLEAFEKEAREQEKRARTMASEHRDLIKSLTADRAALVNRLDDDIRPSWDWACTKHGTKAVVSLVGDACSGCGGIVVPHLALEVRQNCSIVQCTHCRRFLYSANSASTE